MGNKVSRRHAVVDERYTRPQGLYLQRDFNQKKLRRLIRDAKLAPCYPGVEESATNLDECPICFLFYPSLNRSKCCMKGICTECFLQMKSPTPARPPQCPFCKMANYAVEYRGARTLEEKGLEQMEEQKVIEAQIRMRQKELQEEEHRMQRRDEDPREDGICVSSDMVLNEGHGLEGTEVGVSGGPYAGNHMDNNNLGHTWPPPSLLSGSSSARACVGSSGSSISRSNRDVLDLDLEDIMVMEAIWLSIQERDISSDSQIVREGGTDTFLSVTNTSCDHDCEADDSSVTVGLAGAIATSAKKQSLNNSSNSSETLKGSHSETDSHFPSSYMHVNSEGGASKERVCNKSPYYCDVQLWMDNQVHDNDNDDDDDDNQELNNWIEISLETGRTVSPRRCEDISEVGTSFSSRVWEAPEILTVSDSSEEGGSQL